MEFLTSHAAGNRGITDSDRLQTIDEADALTNVYRIFGPYFRYTSTMGLTTADGRSLTMDSSVGDAVARLVADGADKNADAIIELLKPACLRFDLAAVRRQLQDLDDHADRALQTANDNSPNAEAMMQKSRRLFDLHSLSVAETEVSGRTRDQVGQLLDDVAEAVAERPNVLAALASAIRPLAKEFDRSGDMPYLIYQALLRSARRMDHACKDDALPASDPDVDDFRQQLRSIALNLLVDDPQVKKALDARVHFHMRELTDAEQVAMRELGLGLAGISTERLGEQMVEDSITATDPSELDPEAKKGAAYQFGSRVVRMYLCDRKAVEDVAKASSITGFLSGIVSWFIS